MKAITLITILLISLPVYAQTQSTQGSPDSGMLYPQKSYSVAIPLALFVGFGSGHFYARDTWGGIRYIAYDLAGLGIGFITLYLGDYSSRSVILAVGIIMLNRIYEAISAAEAVYYYNKNPYLRELDLYRRDDDIGLVLRSSADVLSVELLRF